MSNNSLNFIRAMVKSRIGDQVDYNHFDALRLLTNAHAAGVSLETLEEIAKSLTGKAWADFDAAILAARAANKVDTRPPTIGDKRIIVRGKLCEIKADGGLWVIKSSRWVLKRNGRWNSWATLVPDDCFETAEAAVEFARILAIK
jgi:hypothetical protein